MSQTGAVLCVGHAAFDAVYRVEALPPRPTKVRATGCDHSVGGMAANAACSIAALGGDARFVGPIGDDEVGDRVVAALRAARVDVSGVIRVAGARTSHSAIIVEADGERLIVSHHGDALQCTRVPPLAALPAVLLVDVRWPSGALACCQAARAQGASIVLDGEMGNPTLLVELVPLADHVIFSETGFSEWLEATGRQRHVRSDREPPDPLLPGLANADPTASALPASRPASGISDLVTRAAILTELSALVSAGATLAAVTFGENGVLWASRATAQPADGDAVRTGHQPAFAVAVAETLGAGDAFHGAYALALAEGRPLDDALRFAAAFAALRCTRTGGNRNLPGRSEALGLLARGV